MGLRPNKAGASRFRSALARLQGRNASDTEDDIADVLARISRTTDGERLLDWIGRQSHGRQLPEGSPEGALREHAALNRFATTIFNLVERGLNRNASPPKK